MNAQMNIEESTGENTDAAGIRAAYRSRMEGLLSPSFSSRVITAVGVGAGSYMLEKLARACPRTIRLVDPDVVEVSNLSRTVYRMSDVGQPKVKAMASRLWDVNPLVCVEALQADVCTLSDQQQDSLCEGADLLIAGTDYFPAQAVLNRYSQRWRIPALFIGIHAGALGGRIVWSLPGVTPCYRCVARERYAQFDAGGTGLDLPAAHGLLVDIQFVDMVALKIALALLERGQDSAMGRYFDRLGGRNDIILRTSPEYAFGNAMWDAVLADLPTAPKEYAQELKEQALFAMDTLWLTTDRDPACPDCGGSKGE